MFFSDVNFNNINLNDCIYNKNNNSYESFITYNNSNNGNSDNLIIFTGKMCLLDTENKGTIKASFIKSNSDFYAFMYKLDKQIINLLFEKSDQLLGIKFKKENIKDLYKKTILLPKKLYECPTIKIYCDNLNELKHNCEIEMEILLEKIIFEKNKCFLKCVAKQLNVLSDICKNDEILFTDNQNTYSDIINYIENV